MRSATAGGETSGVSFGASASTVSSSTSGSSELSSSLAASTSSFAGAGGAFTGLFAFARTAVGAAATASAMARLTASRECVGSSGLLRGSRLSSFAVVPRFAFSTGFFASRFAGPFFFAPLMSSSPEASGRRGAAARW